MKSFVLILLLAVTGTAEPWSNGGKSKSLNNPKFGTHDYIAYEAYRLAEKNSNLRFIRNNFNAFLMGTEAPDVGAPTELNAGSGYKDTTKCHCILFSANGEVTNDRVAIRAQEEFDKAVEALEDDNEELAAFYAGAMAHYIGDLSQFMHIMGSKSHWGSEVQSVHSRYEEVVEQSISFSSKKSSLLTQYMKPEDVSGNNARDVAISVARYVETGDGTIRNTGWMYREYNRYINNGTATNFEAWDSKFRDQTGRNVNAAMNGIAKLLVILAAND